MARHHRKSLHGTHHSIHSSAHGGGQICSPVVSHNTVQGHIHIQHHYHGPREAAAAIPIQRADQSWELKYKESIFSSSERVQEYNSLPAEDVLLSDRYTELLIVQTHRQQKEREEEICSRGTSFFSAREAYKSTSVDQFFRPNDRGDVPKAVILQGHSGHGKSFTVQKILLDWASGSLYQDQFELILHLKCKELNYVSGERCGIDLVNGNQTFTALISQKLKNSPEKVLFLIDGFDELQVPMDEIGGSSVPDLFTPAPVKAILSALLKGSILPDCFLLVTTRPTAADRLSKLLKRPQRFTEILGFSKKGVQEYFQRLCEDQQVSEKVFNSVRANETLFTSCSIPVICWIVCTVFREQVKVNSELTELETTTSIFVHFVSTLLEHHCQGLSTPVPTLLRSLGQLAERGMLEQRILFDRETVLSTVSDPANVPFLCKFHLKKKVSQEEVFSFDHLIFQEFFTALNYFLDQNEEKVKELLGSMQENKANSHLLPVLQFLFGLSNRRVIRELRQSQRPSTPSILRLLKEWILKVFRQSESWMRFALHCLYELHEEAFVREVLGSWEELTIGSVPLSMQDCRVLLYCLQCSPSIRSLKLTECSITPEKLRVLQPALSRCKELGVDLESLSDADVNVLIAVLREGRTLSFLR